MTGSKEIAMKYQTIFRENYFQTRKGNLRCFPQCSEFHMEKTFCGQSVKILVENLNVGPAQAYIFAEIYETDKSKQYTVGDFCDISILKNDDRISVGNFASYEDSEGSITRFVIPSCRKWSVHKNFPRGTNFEFIAYLVVNNKIVSELSSSTFGIQAVKSIRRRSTNRPKQHQQQVRLPKNVNEKVRHNIKPEELLVMNSPDKEEHKVKREKLLMEDQSILYSQQQQHEQPSQFFQQPKQEGYMMNQQQNIPTHHLMYFQPTAQQQQLRPVDQLFASPVTFLPPGINEGYALNQQQQTIPPPPPVSFPTIAPGNFFSNLYFPPVSSLVQTAHLNNHNNAVYNDPTILKVKQYVLHENTLHFKI